MIFHFPYGGPAGWDRCREQHPLQSIGYNRADVVSCLLLGSAHTEYGFLELETESAYRDCSVHKLVREPAPELIRGRYAGRAL
jgi:hypothetical protein